MNFNWKYFNFNKIEKALNNPEQLMDLGKLQVGKIEFKFEILNEQICFKSIITKENGKKSLDQVGRLDLLNYLGDEETVKKWLNNYIKSWSAGRRFFTEVYTNITGSLRQNYYYYSDLMNNITREPRSISY